MQSIAKHVNTIIVFSLTIQSMNLNRSSSCVKKLQATEAQVVTMARQAYVAIDSPESGLACRSTYDLIRFNAGLPTPPIPPNVFGASAALVALVGLQFVVHA